jgi:cobalt-precorrin 5A hydrolase
MIVAGFGFRVDCSLEDMELALAGALALAGLSRESLSALGVPARKADEPSLRALAGKLHRPILPLGQPALEAQSAGAFTRSAHALEVFGVPSVAETAALAGVHALGVEHPVLLAPRHAAGGATCAVASSAASSENDL